MISSTTNKTNKKKREKHMSQKLKGYSIYKISAYNPSELIEFTDTKKQTLNYLGIEDFNNKITNLVKELKYHKNSKAHKNLMRNISNKYDTNAYKVVHITKNYLVIKE